ncbi:hypothetical protein GOEFS_006_00350 [Gordonia effusa NBRC 100432]|uniref:AttH domain-containing protein n=1 Tax=Gordonia effusa NBRC 100432 TaxID=1077974 RepID=H0QUT1_9ACTN|nr:DUF6670 family protein [Gordonia effusa]GAB16582.1 hypothetical protein GOEFS_006_00350 [Gordonia effusa NBRC 100432]
MLSRLYDTAVSQINRIDSLNGEAFDPTIPQHPPTAGWKLVHYGIMVPSLPAPFNFFDVISVLGTAKRVRAFSVPYLVRTVADDSAWLLLGSAASRHSFRQYSIESDCDLAADGSTLRFGDTLRIERSARGIHVEAAVDNFSVELNIRPTNVVSHFAHLPSIYDHWSVLCEYDGTFTVDGDSLDAAGLCTYEYARGRQAPLPIYFFTYQILNATPTTQVLMTDLRGPAGLPIQRMVFVRTVGRNGATYSRGFVHEVTEPGSVITTPDGVAMQLPSQFTWRVEDAAGDELIKISGISNDDWAYGMAAGFAGSYEYTGTLHGEPISGRGYIEWIDRR